jgi:hypothetical protein
VCSCTAGTQSYPVFLERPPLSKPLRRHFSERQRATHRVVSMSLNPTLRPHFFG